MVVFLIVAMSHPSSAFRLPLLGVPPYHERLKQQQQRHRKALAVTQSNFNDSHETRSDGLSRGDARGAALLLENVSVFRGTTTTSGGTSSSSTGAARFIVQDIDWRIEPKAKWGLVGANGRYVSKEGS
jgi:uncharacterized short protein YbdD (DUF466 family)